jgi:hypothetical protein
VPEALAEPCRTLEPVPRYGWLTGLGQVFHLRRYPDIVTVVPPESGSDHVRTLVALTREQHDWLRTKAFHARTSIAAEIRDLVEKEMNKEADRADRQRRGR